MANIKEMLLEESKENNELIEAIVVGVHYDRKYDGEVRPDENIILSLEQGLAKLDEEYDDGYGGADCYPMYAWSKNWIYVINEYDGSTRLSSIPRNPINCKPKFQ